MGELKTIAAKVEADVLHVPEEVKKVLGKDTKLIVGTAAVVAFSGAASYSDILRSIELIQDDIRLRADQEKSKSSKLKKSHL